MPQFFVKSSDIIHNSCRITGDDFRHLVAARRIRRGDSIRLRDEAGALFLGRVEEITDSFIQVALLEERNFMRRPVEITLCMSLLKGKNFDKLIEKAVEIGVSRIIPVVSERTTPHPADDLAKLVRWKRKALEAAKQSMGESVPEVERIHSFEEVIGASHDGIRMMAHPGSERSLKDFLRQNRHVKTILLVGPEGGFSQKEVDEAVRAGWACVNFGFSQLRAGTAAVVLCGIIIYEWGMN